MPNTPRVQFNFENNNVQNSTPLLGVSHVVARTTKGPFNSPDKVFNTYSAFQEVYGEEIVHQRRGIPWKAAFRYI